MRLGYCELIFKYREGNDKWIIGSNFFDNYVTVFNYDDQEILCYSTTKFEIFKCYSIQKVIYIFNSFIMLCFIIEYSGLLRKIKKGW